MAASAPFQQAYESQRRRQYEALGTAMDAAARREAAKYGQAPVQPQRESIGATIAKSLAPAAGDLATGLIGGIFGSGNQPATTGSSVFSSGANFSNLFPAGTNFGSTSFSSGALDSTFQNAFNPSLSFNFLS